MLARCYSEIIDVAVYGETLKECGNCKLLFVPDRPNEKFCNRLQFQYPHYRTCKEIGPQKLYQKSLELDERKAKYRREYVRRFQQTRRLREKYGPGSAEYQKAQREFKEWVERSKKELGN